MRLQDTTLDRWNAKYGEFRGALKEAHPEFVEPLKTGKAEADERVRKRMKRGG